MPSKKPVPLDPELRPPTRQHALFVYGVTKGSLRCEMQSSVAPCMYRMAVRISDGACACECKWFEHHCKWAQPTIYSGTVCKHFRDFREFLQKEVAIEKEEITRKEAQEEFEDVGQEADGNKIAI